MRLMASCLVGWSVIVLVVAGAGAAGDVRLIQAAKTSDHSAAQALLQQKVDVNAAQPDGATALHWAAYRDDLHIADLLIRAGADVNAKNQLGVAPLYLACENGNAAMVEALLKGGGDPNAALPSGETALMTAARSGSVGAVKALIGRGADANARERMDGQTALMWAVSRQHPEVVDVLIRAGGDVNAPSDVRRQVVSRHLRPCCTARGSKPVVMEEGGFTPLLFASRVGDLASARLLLAAGADVNVTTPDGASALVIAAHSGQTAVATLLLEKGADPDTAGALYTALHAAVLRDDLRLLQTLLGGGADPNATVISGTEMQRQAKYFGLDGGLVGATPFFLAAKYANTAAMDLLVAAGADPQRGLGDGTTPLMAAAGMLTRGLGRGGKDRKDRDMDSAQNDLAYGQDEDLRAQMNSGISAVKLAVEQGADVNAANTAGETALHSAARHGLETVIEFLVSEGAQLDAKTERGQTPLMIVENIRDGNADAEKKQSAAVTADLIHKLRENQ